MYPARHYCFKSVSFKGGESCDDMSLIHILVGQAASVNIVGPLAQQIEHLRKGQSHKEIIGLRSVRDDKEHRRFPIPDAEMCIRDSSRRGRASTIPPAGMPKVMYLERSIPLLDRAI